MPGTRRYSPYVFELFGKRPTEDRPDTSIDCKSSIPSSSKLLLGYILKHADNDQMPYLGIDILGCKGLGLLDSGTSNTILGGPGWNVD